MATAYGNECAQLHSTLRPLLSINVRLNYLPIVNADGSMTETDACSGSTTPVDVSSVDNLNGIVLGYQDGIYQVMSAPPVANPAQETFYAGWCWKKAGAQSPGSSVGASVGFLVQETRIFSSQGSPSLPLLPSTDLQQRQNRGDAGRFL